MAKTSINWTDKVWNPVRGCSKVSPGCANCYAERFASRFSGTGMPYHGLVRDGRWANVARFVPDMLVAPLHWKQPCRVFVNSMSDLFHDDISDEQIADAFGVMAVAASKFFGSAPTVNSHRDFGPHTFQVLTKRANRLRLLGSSRFRELVAKAAYRHAMYRVDAGWLSQCISGRREPGNHCTLDRMWPLPNVHLGVSCENQEAAEERIPLLLECPAAVRWISCEPLLSALDIRKYLKPTLIANNGERLQHPDPRVPSTGGTWRFGLDWVVCGCESGPNARPPHPDWVRSMRDQCREAGVPFHFKQWGEWRESADGPRCVTRDGRNMPNLEPSGNNGDGAVRIARVGKAVAGNLLDGVRYEMRPGDKW